MTTDTIQKEYDIGYESGLNALDTLDKFMPLFFKTRYNYTNIWAGLLTALLSGLYVHAPTKLVADEIVKFAKKSAVDARKESRKK